MPTGGRGHLARLVLAFLAIYVLWGSTYLAIRVAVETVPPLFAAGVRFAIAGSALFAWSRLRGAPGPSRHEWRNLTILGALMFLVTYSVLFWKAHLSSAGGQMMTGGAMLLACSVALGEVPPLPDITLRAAAAIAYQIVAGSLIAFTAYEWLSHVSPTKVTSYAYVNPVVALIIGHELGGEAIGAKTIVGAVLVLVSTIALLRRRESR
jgi:drug/metabolite transporter (DMT)-like permease